ncbi:MAG: hypothetical protein QW751_01055 [Candidatus Aenigmatarchaeota archaeon]
MNKPDSARLLAYLKYNFTIRPAEWRRLKLLVPQLVCERRINVYSDFAFHALNVENIEHIRLLVGLARAGCRLVMVLRGLSRNVPYQPLATSGGVDALYGVMRRLGVPRDRIHIYHFSDMLRRCLMEHENFARFLAVVGEVNLSGFLKQQNIAIFYKLKHLFNYPLDIFITNHVDRLMPELGMKEIDIIVSRNYHTYGTRHEPLYMLTRELMIQAGLIKGPTPAIIHAKYMIPRMADVGVPNPDMSMREHEIVDVISQAKTIDWNKDPILMLRGVLIPQLGTFIVGSKQLDLSAAERWLRKASRSEKIRALARNIYLYFRSVENEFGLQPLSYPHRMLQATNARDLGRVLKSKHLISILQLADGTRDAATIAKQLHIHPANLSKYMKILEEGGFLSVNEKGLPIRCLEKVTVDLQG